jgi:hypothetical protein
LTPEEIEAIGRRADLRRPPIRLTTETVTIEAPSDGEAITVHYTRDGSIPSASSPSFVGSATFDRLSDGSQVIACRAQSDDGTVNYRAFAFPADS